MLFILVVEMLAIQLRRESAVRGIFINGIEIKLSQYCDDMTVFVRDEQSASKVLEKVHAFTPLAGLALNMQKCFFHEIRER